MSSDPNHKRDEVVSKFPEQALEVCSTAIEDTPTPSQIPGALLEKR